MNAAADAEFMHGRWSQLVRLGYGLTGDQQLAEGLAQTALAQVYASWPRVRRTGSPPQPVPQAPGTRTADGLAA